MTETKPVVVKYCPKCPNTWMSVLTSKGDYYCTSCRHRHSGVAGKRTVLKPTPNIPTRAFTKSRGYVLGIKDHKTHMGTGVNKAIAGRHVR